MDWITDTLAIGGMADALDFQRLEEEGVEAVLQLHAPDGERVEFFLPIDVLQLEVEDRRALSPRLLTQGVKFIRRQQMMGRKTLVCCGAGMSRSPTFVAAYFYEDGLGLVEAFRLIREKRPVARPHSRLLASLVEHYGPGISAVDLAAAIVGRGSLRAGDDDPDEDGSEGE